MFNKAQCQKNKLNLWEYIIYLFYKDDCIYGTLFNLANKMNVFGYYFNRTYLEQWLDDSIDNFVKNRDLTKFGMEFARVCNNKMNIKIAKFVINKINL